MTATRTWTLAAACAAWLASGCATAAKKSLQPLPAAERQAFWRCEPYLWARFVQQSGGEQVPLRPEFVTSTAEYYAKLRDEAARRDFLAAGGCPPEAVAGPPAGAE